MLSHLHDITYRFTTIPPPPKDFFESLIPLPMQIASANSDIGIYSATLYTALHPLFTTPDACFSTMPSDASSRLFHIVAKSASIIIDHLARLNDDDKIISIWMAAERVLESGLVWASYLMSQSRTTTTGADRFSTVGSHAPMSPILKVSALLASFAARWNSGSAYVDAWELW